ncbi:hypothetical protein STEG23_011325, partial [Scotinomys teguina]
YVEAAQTSHGSGVDFFISQCSEDKMPHNVVDMVVGSVMEIVLRLETDFLCKRLERIHLEHEFHEFIQMHFSNKAGCDGDAGNEEHCAPTELSLLWGTLILFTFQALFSLMYKAFHTAQVHAVSLLSVTKCYAYDMQDLKSTCVFMAAQPFASANYKLDLVYMKPSPAIAGLQRCVFVRVPPIRSF